MEEENYNETGGLRLMTVFIVVLLLHVLVIGGISAYHYMANNGDVIAETDGSFDALPDDFSDDFAEETVVAETGLAPAPEASGRLSLSPRDQFAMIPDNSPQAAPVDNSSPAPTPTRRPEPAPAPRTASAETNVIDLDAPAPAAPAPAPQPEAPATVAAATGTYTVSKGDTLWSIARQHKMKVSEVKSLNSLDSDVIRIGQTLKVTGSTATAAAPAPASTPAPAPAPATAVVTEVVQATVPVIDRSTYVYDGAEPTAPVPAAASAQTHTVAKGETLWRIARQYKTTPAAIANANGITDPSKVKIGTTLRIPSSDARNAVSAPPATPAASAPSADLVMNR
ncbi:MAG: LysM peptidoglycan-binding domain-containing protein [Verrucomicrobiota bacterium]